MMKILSLILAAFCALESFAQSGMRNGRMLDTGILFNDVTDGDATTSKHGFVKKPSGETNQVLHGRNDWRWVPGVENIRTHGGSPNGTTACDTAWTAAKTAAGTNGIVHFPFYPGTSNIYYFSASVNLGGARIRADDGVIISVNGLDVGVQIITDGDIDLLNRLKGKRYTLPGNRRDQTLFKDNVSRATYSSATYLTFTGDFTAGQMGYLSATPAAPGVAFTTTTNASTIETASVATTNYLGHWIRPQIGQTVEMVLSTLAAQTSGHAQAVIMDSTGTEYCGVEVIDYANTLKSLTFEVNLIRMSAGARTRITRKAVLDRNWMLGHNGTTGHQVLVGVKMISATTAQFYVNHVLMGTMTLASGNNCDRVFFAMNGAYSGAANGFYDPVSYQDKIGSEQKSLAIACFGDSVTAGSHTVWPHPEFYARLLEGREGIGQVTVSNYGVSGHTVANMDTVMSGVTLANFTDVVLFIGINDIVAGTLSSSFESTLLTSIGRAQSAGCNVVVAIPPMFNSSAGNDVRGRVRGICQRAGLTKGVRIADVLAVISAQTSYYNVGDLIHPWALGMFMNAQAICREIEQFYAAPAIQVLSAIRRRSDGSVILSGTAAPTTGYWRVRDTVEFSTPTAGGYSGTVCVTAGSPGTWKSYGAILP